MASITFNPIELSFHATIRSLSLTDLEAVEQIESQQAFAWSSALITSSLNDHHSMGLFVEDRLVGFAFFDLVLDELCLLNIVVDQNERKKGYAKQLLTTTLSHFGENGAKSCFLEVRVSNSTAIHFYQSLGFIECGKRKNYYPSDKGKEDALVYKADLPLNALNTTN